MQGLVPTVLRDGPGVGVWILGFEASKEMIRSQRGPLHRDAPLSFPELLLAGMVAGISFWTGEADRVGLGGGGRFKWCGLACYGALSLPSPSSPLLSLWGVEAICHMDPSSI